MPSRTDRGSKTYTGSPAAASRSTSTRRFSSATASTSCGCRSMMAATSGFLVPPMVVLPATPAAGSVQ